ncbi:MAG TPA: YtxH domain-containing protein [Actinomycetota bacterium]|nr:YtxH domain-containing protein [Actinomycetota bacterium]
MGFKSGLLVGFGVGYVLGSKAGRERYDELRAAWDQFVGNPSVQRVVTKGREVVDTGVNRGIRAVEDASDEVKNRVEGTSAGKGSTTSS